MLFHSLGLHWKDSYVWTFPFLMKLPNCLLLINSLAIDSDVGCLKTFEHLGLFLLSLASKTFIICLRNEIRILTSHQERLIQIWFYSLISYPISTPKSSLCPPPQKLAFNFAVFSLCLRHIFLLKVPFSIRLILCNVLHRILQSLIQMPLPLGGLFISRPSELIFSILVLPLPLFTVITEHGCQCSFYKNIICRYICSMISLRPPGGESLLPCLCTPRGSGTEWHMVGRQSIYTSLHDWVRSLGK